MGYDFCNQHVFVGERDAKLVRAEIINYISSTLAKHSVPERDAERSIAVGPPGRWIFVGDNAGDAEEGDSRSFDALSVDLSRIAPTLAIKMSDSAIVHLYLYSSGSIIDKFGNGTLPIFLFQSPDEARPFLGICEKWDAFLLASSKPDTLRKVWSHDNDAMSILTDTAQLFGLHPELAWTGYSTFDEADEIKYLEWLDDEVLKKGPFDEFHFTAT